jgi:hypothetical protein
MSRRRMFYIMFNIYIFNLWAIKQYGLLSITFDPAYIGVVPNLFVFWDWETKFG